MSIFVDDIKIIEYWEIISKSNSLSGSRFYLIYSDLLESALDPPPSALTSSGLD